ncbi:MAG: PepSY domain-containing protein [Actinomycetota bacterium]|nr:PepSY domain-containing protein [Actinomycetota bacterium]
MTLEQAGPAVETDRAGTATEDGATGSPASRRAALRPLLWRLHFLGGFLAAPVVLSLAITGILFAWNPQIEAALHRNALAGVADGPAQPLGEQVRTARAEHPGWDLVTVTPAAPGGEQTTAVTLGPLGAAAGELDPASGAVTVYVDPASAAVTGEITEAHRPDEWLRSLHSSWHLGPIAEPLTELAASWVLVSLLTGLYLWWPRDRRALARAFRFRHPGRLRARSVHSTLGVGILAALLLVVGTGLTWTTYAGAWIDAARAQLQSDTPSVSTQLAGTGAVGAGGHEHPGHDTDSSTAPAATSDPAAGIDRVAAAARGAGLAGVLALDPPDEAGQAWTASVEDSRWPIESATVAVDPATGQVTDRVVWSDYPLLAKATTLGIVFHQAELFGLATQIGLTVLAVALIVLIIAGYRMWWLRRPAGGLGVPPGAGALLRTVPVPLLLGFGALMVLLPTLGVSFLIYLAAERLLRAIRTLARAHP